MGVCVIVLFELPNLIQVADDLGVIAEVIICESFKTKFAPNDTETSVISSHTTEQRLSNRLVGDWLCLSSQPVHVWVPVLLAPVEITWGDDGPSL